MNGIANSGMFFKQYGVEAGGSQSRSGVEPGGAPADNRHIQHRGHSIAKTCAHELPTYRGK